VEPHLHLDKVMLVVVVLAINLAMPEFLGVVAVLVPQVPMAATLFHNLATAVLEYCGLMVITTPVAAAAETGLQGFLPATAVLGVVALVDRKVLAQPAPEEVPRLTVEQMVTKVTLIQEIHLVVPQVPILAAAGVVPARVNIQVTPAPAVPVDRVQ
jgi:hypothetical protein